MIDVTFEMYHSDFNEGVEPVFEMEFEINHVPRIGEKIHFKELIDKLDELGLYYHSSKKVSVSDITNQFIILPDGTCKNLIIITSEIID